jgi:hypothetical protein
MKTRLTTLIVILIAFLIGCEKEESTKYEKIDVTLNSFTGCSITAKSSIVNIPKVRLIGESNGRLTVKMINTEFCCGTDSVSTNISINQDKINIEIIDNGPFSYCFCPHDIELNLTSLATKDYELTLIESENAYSRDTFLIQFTYSEDMDTTISGVIGANSQIRSVNTILGGCNNQDFENLKSATEEYSDTVDFEIINSDTLNVFVGINYICCAPFDTETDIVNDTLIMTISDTCSDPYHSCYCRCMCYYTWDFQYTDFENKKYFYIIKLNDPREDNTIIFKQGMIDLTNNLP